MIVDSNCEPKNNNASLQNDKLMHTASESYCNVYISKRAIVDISCIGLQVRCIQIKYYDVNFKRETYKSIEPIPREQVYLVLLVWVL